MKSVYIHENISWWIFQRKMLFVFKKKVLLVFNAGFVGPQLSKSPLCHCVSNCKTEMLHAEAKLPEKCPWCSGNFYSNYLVYSLSQPLCISKHSIMNHVFRLTTEPLAAIVLLIPPQEILKSWAWVQKRGLHACFEKKHSFNNDWNQAKSFDPTDHFTLLTLPLCSQTWLQLLIMYSI